MSFKSFWRESLFEKALDALFVTWPYSIGFGTFYGAYKGFSYARKEYLSGTPGSEPMLVILPVTCGLFGAIGGAIPPIGLAALYTIEHEKRNKD